MSTAQIQNLIAQNSKDLPKEVLQEILDFIQFLKFKRSGVAADSVHNALSGLNSSEEKHLDEEFINYKTIYPAE